MTTCPSGVNYMHLVDHGRRHIERTYRRPLLDRWSRWVLATVLPRTGLFRLALRTARLAQPVRALLPARLQAMLELAPRAVERSAAIAPQVFPAEGARRMRVALLTGCVQQVIDAAINQATLRLLRRHGAEVVVVPGVGCCGALAHHLGEDVLDRARANIDAWTAELERGLDAIVINASGCGTMVKDYGFLLREDRAYAAKAARISALAKDVSEVVEALGLNGALTAGPRVAYHSACSLQHGQKIHAGPKQLLQKAGFEVVEVPEGHLCCGSAGTYNMLQPELASALRERKLRNIATVEPEIVAAGNIGCITQLQVGAGVPVMHTVELLDWATGGPKPEVIERAQAKR